MNKNLNIGEPVQAPVGGIPSPSLQALLSEQPFLRDLSPHQVRLLLDCALHVKFQPNELIFCAGDPADRFYLIHKGKVALESYVKDRGIVQIQSVGAGEVLGWSWLFPPYLWHFDAKALEPTEAVFFHGAALRDECEADHDLGFELLKRMGDVMINRLHATRREALRILARATGAEGVNRKRAKASANSNAGKTLHAVPMDKESAASHRRADGMEPDNAWLKRHALISQQPFFRGFTPKQLELLADDALEMEFAANEVIYREGDFANRFYLITRGSVVLESEVEGRAPIQTQTLGPGDDLGWSWLFSPHSLQSNARTAEPTKVIFFYGTRLREQCERDHDLGYQIMKRMTGVILNRLQAARRQLVDRSLDIGQSKQKST